MSLSKRNSRKIVVDELTYRWSPSQDSGYMTLVVQHESGTGCKLEIIISDDKNIVVENGSYTIEIGESNRLMIKPRLVEQLVRDSIVLGWSPRIKGKPLELSFVDNKLRVRRGI